MPLGLYVTEDANDVVTEYLTIVIFLLSCTTPSVQQLPLRSGCLSFGGEDDHDFRSSSFSGGVVSARVTERTNPRGEQPVAAWAGARRGVGGGGGGVQGLARPEMLQQEVYRPGSIHTRPSIALCFRSRRGFCMASLGLQWGPRHVVTWHEILARVVASSQVRSGSIPQQWGGGADVVCVWRGVVERDLQRVLAFPLYIVAEILHHSTSSCGRAVLSPAFSSA